MSGYVLITSNGVLIGPWQSREGACEFADRCGFDDARVYEMYNPAEVEADLGVVIANAKWGVFEHTTRDGTPVRIGPLHTTDDEATALQWIKDNCSVGGRLYGVWRIEQSAPPHRS